MSKLAELQKEHENYQRAIASIDPNKKYTLEILEKQDKKVIQDMLMILAKQAISDVRYEMPIGEYNVYGTRRTPSNIRTASWSIPMVGLAREEPHEWIKKLSEKTGKDESTLEPSEGISRFNYSIDGENPLTDGSKKHFSEDEIRVVNQALRASLFKAGNCGEMARLGIVKLCQAYTQHLSKGNLSAAESDQITFELFSFVEPALNHALIRISMNGVYVICDPWLNEAFEMTNQGLQKLKDMLLKDFNPKDPVVFDRRLQILAHALQTENPNHPYIKPSISGPKEAKKIVDLYEKNEKAMRNMIAQNQRDPAPFPNVAAYEKIKNASITGVKDIGKANTIKLEKQIQEYEFAKNIPVAQLKRNIDLLEYIAGHSEFAHKPSAENLITSIVNNCPTDQVNSISAQLNNIKKINSTYASIIVDALSPYGTPPSENTADSILLKKYELYLKKNVFLVPELPPKAWDGHSTSGKLIRSMLEGYLFPRDIAPNDIGKYLAFLEFIAEHKEIATNQSAHSVIQNILRAPDDNQTETLLKKLNKISENPSYAGIILQSFKAYATEVKDITPDVFSALRYESYLNNFLSKTHDLYSIPKLPPKFNSQDDTFINIFKEQIADLIDKCQFPAKIFPRDLMKNLDLLEYIAVNDEFALNKTAINVIINTIKHAEHHPLDFILKKLINIAKNEKRYATIILQLLHPYATEISEITDVALMSKKHEHYFNDSNQFNTAELPPFEWYESTTGDGELRMKIQQHIKEYEFPELISKDQWARSLSFLDYLSNHSTFNLPKSSINVLIRALDDLNDIYSYGPVLIKIAQNNPIFEKMVLDLLKPLATSKENITVETLVLKSYQRHLESKGESDLFNQNYDTPENFSGKHYDHYSPALKALMLSSQKKAFAMQYFLLLCANKQADSLTDIISPEKKGIFDEFVEAGALQFSANKATALDHVIVATMEARRHPESYKTWIKIAEKLVSNGASLSTFHYPDAIDSLNSFSQESPFPVLGIKYEIIYKAEPSLFHLLFNAHDLDTLCEMNLISHATTEEVFNISTIDNHRCKVSHNGNIYLHLNDNSIKLIDNDILMIRHIFNAFPEVNTGNDQHNDDEEEILESLGILANIITDKMIEKIGPSNVHWVRTLSARELATLYVHFEHAGIDIEHPNLMRELKGQAFLLKGQHAPEAHLLNDILDPERDVSYFKDPHTNTHGNTL